MRRTFFVACIGALALCAPALAAPLPLSTQLADALAVPGNSAASSGAVALDLATAQTLFIRNPDLPLVPASNEKLTVTFAALTELGSEYRFRTEVLARGHQDGAVW